MGTEWKNIRLLHNIFHPDRKDIQKDDYERIIRHVSSEERISLFFNFSPTNPKTEGERERENLHKS